MSYAPNASPRPQARPDDLHTTQTNSSGGSSASYSTSSDGSSVPPSASAPPPSRPTPPAHSDSDSSPSWESFGTPELFQPNVMAALKESPSDSESESVLETVTDIAADVVFGGDNEPDTRLLELSPEQRVELSFDQRIEAGTAATVLGMGTADAVGAVKNVLPPVAKIPAQVLIGTGVGRLTFPPMKEVSDWYHGDVLNQPIVDPAPGILTEENMADFVPGVVSTSAGLGAQALTTTALTALGVSNPIVLTVAGLGTGVYAAGKAWVWTDEVAIPATADYVIDTITDSIDVAGLTGVPSGALSDGPHTPPTIEELEALWDSVADDVSDAESPELQPSIGVLAPDSWTLGDIVRYEATGDLPEFDPELEELLVRHNLAPHVLEQGTEPDELVVDEPTAVFTSVRPLPRSDTLTFEPVVPTAVRAPEAIEPDSEPVDVVLHDNDDSPDPQCLIPFWLIPYVDELTAYGVRNFCALKDLSPADIEEILDELAEVPEVVVATEDATPDMPLVFMSTRSKPELDEEAESEVESASIFCFA